MPGLIRGVARTAVAAGTWTAVSNGVSRRQANRWANQYEAQQPTYAEAPPPPPAEPSTDDKLTQLKELGELKAAGVLTEEEFQNQKAKILAG
jgi:hypothetical protein